jgi:hypothetical protein
LSWGRWSWLLLDWPPSLAVPTSLGVPAKTECHGFFVPHLNDEGALIARQFG